MPAAGREQAQGEWLEPFHTQLPLWQVVPVGHGTAVLPLLELPLEPAEPDENPEVVAALPLEWDTPVEVVAPEEALPLD